MKKLDDETAQELERRRRIRTGWCSSCGGSGKCPDCSDVDADLDAGELHCSRCQDTGECPDCN